jgi:uncharacterized protein (DUF2141 family)
MLFALACGRGLLCKWPWLLLLAILVAPEARHAQASELRIAVEGVRSPEGSLLIGLYDTADSFNRAIAESGKEGFLNDPRRVAGAALRANGGLRAGVVFTNLRPGLYAIIAFHDENGNGKLDKNFWGVPIEPYGFSNGARAHLGPPSFADAVISITDENAISIITLFSHAAALSGSSSPRDHPDP